MADDTMKLVSLPERDKAQARLDEAKRLLPVLKGALIAEGFTPGPGPRPVREGLTMIKIFADTASLAEMRTMAADPRVAGYTTNPTLMRVAGVEDYRAFALEALEVAGGRPVSFEVTSDDVDEMGDQAREIASWGPSAYVKVPVMTTSGTPTYALLEELSFWGVPLNVTAVFTLKQVTEVGRALDSGTAPAIVSVFAGRIADAGHDPFLSVQECRTGLAAWCPRAEMLWASPRQVYDAVLAQRAGCDIITMTPAMISKLGLRGKDLTEFSRETVQMFYDDARAAGYMI